MNKEMIIAFANLDLVNLENWIKNFEGKEQSKQMKAIVKQIQRLKVLLDEMLDL